MEHNFYKLEIWQKARLLVTIIYNLCQNYPTKERYGLTSQMQRAAVSVPSNIAEGCGRGSTKQLLHFLDIAIGSLCELETQVHLAKDLGYISVSEETSMIKEIAAIRRMTLNFQKSFRK